MFLDILQLETIEIDISIIHDVADFFFDQVSKNVLMRGNVLFVYCIYVIALMKIKKMPAASKLLMGLVLWDQSI